MSQECTGRGDSPCEVDNYTRVQSLDGKGTQCSASRTRMKSDSLGRERASKGRAPAEQGPGVGSTRQAGLPAWAGHTSWSSACLLLEEPIQGRGLFAVSGAGHAVDGGVTPHTPLIYPHLNMQLRQERGSGSGRNII